MSSGIIFPFLSAKPFLLFFCLVCIIADSLLNSLLTPPVNKMIVTQSHSTALSRLLFYHCFTADHLLVFFIQILWFGWPSSVSAGLSYNRLQNRNTKKAENSRSIVSFSQESRLSFWFWIRPTLNYYLRYYNLPCSSSAAHANAVCIPAETSEVVLVSPDSGFLSILAHWARSLFAYAFVVNRQNALHTLGKSVAQVGRGHYSPPTPSSLKYSVLAGGRHLSL